MSSELSVVVQLITLLLAAGAMVVALVAALTRGASPAEIDADVAARIDAIRRDHIRMLEAQYAQGNALQRQLVDTLGVLVKAVAPLTTGKADDKLSEFIEDIQQQGSTLPETTGKSAVSDK